jgi:hypothetical protein
MAKFGRAIETRERLASVLLKESFVLAATQPEIRQNQLCCQEPAIRARVFNDH